MTTVNMLTFMFFVRLPRSAIRVPRLLADFYCEGKDMNRLLGVGGFNNNIFDLVNRQCDFVNIQKAGTIHEYDKIIEDVAPTPGILCIYHSHVLNQFSNLERKEFQQWIESLGKKRDFFYLSVEAGRAQIHPVNSDDIIIVLHNYKQGRATKKILGRTDGHCTWIEWFTDKLI